MEKTTKRGYSLEKLIPEQSSAYAGVSIASLSEKDKEVLQKGEKSGTVFHLKDAQMSNNKTYTGPARLYMLSEKDGSNAKLMPLVKLDAGKENFNITPDGAVWLADGKKLENKDAEKFRAGLPVVYSNQNYQYENGKIKLDDNNKRMRSPETTQSVAIYDKELNRAISRPLVNSLIDKLSPAIKKANGEDFSEAQDRALKNGAVFSNEKDGIFYKTNYNPITNKVESAKISKTEFEQIQVIYPKKENTKTAELTTGNIPSIKKDLKVNTPENKQVKEKVKAIKPPKQSSAPKI